ncbi:MAG TPA: hypothetical protein PJ991_01105 [Kiritimatiellia bacterium]|nr:hypothetical protein [Kiritimatiellia bacterium]
MMKKWQGILIVLIGIGILLRIAGALLLSGSYSRDHTVPCLMAKHISEGVRFPAMYYGQAYLGSLEAYFGAVFYRLPIDKNFACNLGTALFGIAIIPLIWYWGRRAGGITAGLFALGLLTIGPPIYMQFMNWSFGAYAALTFFNTATLLLAMKIIEVHRGRNSVPGFHWMLALGFVAGLAWWSGPLVLPGLITTAMLFLFHFRTKCLRLPVLSGVSAAFIAGSLPFWLWNYQNEWASLKFIRSGTSGSFSKGLVLYAKAMADTAMDSMVDWSWLVGLLFLAAIIYGFLVTWRVRGEDASRLHLLTALLLVVVAMLFYARKPEQIGPPRYYLPLLPALAVLTGNALAVLNRKTKILGWLILIVLLVPQVRFIPVCWKWYQERHAYFAELDAMRPYFESLDTDIIYADYSIREYGFGMNFYFDEAFCFTEIPLQERMYFYLQKAEMESYPAFLNRFRLIHDFLEQTGGSADVFRFVRGFWMTHRLKPSPIHPVAVTNGFRIIESVSGSDITDRLTDHNKATYWKNARVDGGKQLIVEFEQPTDVAKIRWIAEPPFRPILLSVDVRRHGDDTWHTVIDNWLYTEWYWSGPRPYAHGGFDRLETWKSFGKIEAMRITFNKDDTHTYVQVSEFHVFAPGPEQRTAAQIAPDIQPLIEFLKAHSIRKIYADRWEANQLYLRGPDGWLLSLDDVAMVKETRRMPARIVLDVPFAMVSREENQAITASVLDKLGLEYEFHQVGIWRIYLVNADETYRGEMPMIWRGFGPQLTPSFPWINEMCKRAESSLRDGHVDDAHYLASKVLAIWPDYLPALVVLAECAMIRGENSLEYALRDKIEQFSPVNNFTPVRFFNGIRLVGVRPDRIVAKPGENVILRWHWVIPGSTDMTAWAVFVHIKDRDGKTAFQGDRVLGSERLNIARVDEGRIVELQTLHVPDDMAAGAYSVHTGLYLANPPHKRNGIWSTDRRTFMYRRAVLPTEFTVETR